MNAIKKFLRRARTWMAKRIRTPFDEPYDIPTPPMAAAGKRKTIRKKKKK